MVEGRKKGGRKEQTDADFPCRASSASSPGLGRRQLSAASHATSPGEVLRSTHCPSAAALLSGLSLSQSTSANITFSSQVWLSGGVEGYWSWASQAGRAGWRPPHLVFTDKSTRPEPASENWLPEGVAAEVSTFLRAVNVPQQKAGI